MLHPRNRAKWTAKLQQKIHIHKYFLKKIRFFVFFLLFAISICLFLRLYVHSAGFYPAFYFVRCTG